MQALYRLAPTAFACAHGEDVVILDVAHNRYLAVSNLPMLDRYVIDWPSCCTDDATATADSQQADDARTTIGALLSRGLLERSQRRKSSPRELRITPAISELTSDDCDDYPIIAARTACQFAAVMLATGAQLRFTPLRRTLERFRARRNRLAAALDPPAAHRLIHVFCYLRPYVASSRDTCLLDALALGSLLIKNGQRCSLVFGVRTQPFSAHCWLQSDGTVLNDTLEGVATFTPIMVV